MAANFAEDEDQNILANLNFDELTFSDDDENELGAEFKEGEIIIDEDDIEMANYLNLDVENTPITITFVPDSNIPMVVVAGEENETKFEKPKLVCGTCGKPYQKKKCFEKHEEKCGKDFYVLFTAVNSNVSYSLLKNVSNINRYCLKKEGFEIKTIM